MAGRGRTSFQKRQKEQIRLERRQAKAARKDARKAGKTTSAAGPEDDRAASEFTPDNPDQGRS